MTSREIRRQFVDFFESKGHVFVPSSPVVPHDDPTLMFTNAGMNQFKPIFLGTERAAHPRAANSQKCIRAGGKHNDLDDVGQDTYHHTFFEMLGNWSFGDYFKKEAIEWAWELLTKVWGIDKTRLHATYFGGLRRGTKGRRDEGTEGENQGSPNRQSTIDNRQSGAEWELEPDYEARDLWASVTDIDASHIHPGSMKDNFWEMGDAGPCGPCSEIHIDLTPDKSGRDLVNKGDARVMELWNLVFIQYNRASDGKLTPLPAKHVDTGMGFERLCAILQKKTSNYDTDVFTPIFEAIRKRTNAPGYTGLLPGNVAPVSNRCEDSGHRLETGATTPQVLIDVSYRVIADHVRCLTFALTDGAIPSNEGRGYVLRRILRRAVRYGRQYLNMHEPFLCDLVPTVVEHMADTFPELRTAHRGKNVEHAVKLIREEEESFLRTLDRGIEIFENEIFHLLCSTIPGKGIDEIEVYDRERNVSISKSATVISDRTTVWRRHRIVVQDPSTYQLHVVFERVPVLSGRVAFALHDTYGFPVDLTQLMARERSLAVDIVEYEQLMEQARERARCGKKSFHGAAIYWHDLSREMLVKQSGRSRFTGYEGFSASAKVMGIVKGSNVSQFSLTIHKDEEGVLILDSTPFYPEKGGQTGDRGRVIASTGEFVVEDTQEIDGVIVHIGRCVSGLLTEHNPEVGRNFAQVKNLDVAHVGPAESYLSSVNAELDVSARRPTMKNHTATHILNWALREVLCPAEERTNPHVQQKGSLVDPEKTRFDFSHGHALSGEEISRIEEHVRSQITDSRPVFAATREADFIDQKQARQINTLRAVFGEKYPPTVRVVSIGADIAAMLADPTNPKWMQYSVEFCGGTHVKTTKEIGDFVLVHEEGVAKGVRRVVGLTGERARTARELGDNFLSWAESLRQGTTPPYPPLVKGGSILADALSQAGGVPPPPLTKGGTEGGLGPQSGPYDLARLLRELSDPANQIPVLTRHQLADQIAKLQESVKADSKKSAAAAQRGAVEAVGDLLASKAIEVGGVTVVVGEVPGGNADALRNGIDFVRNKKGSSAVLLATVSDGKVTLVAGMSRDVVERGVKAGDLVKDICPLVGGKGGGRPDMAQGGGPDAKGLDKALESALAWLSSRLG